MSLAAGDLRSRARFRLPRFPPRIKKGKGLAPSPLRGSTLMTSAPRSESIMVPRGAAIKELKSKTFIPSRGCLSVLLLFVLFPDSLEEFPVWSSDASTSAGAFWPSLLPGIRVKPISVREADSPSPPGPLWRRRAAATFDSLHQTTLTYQADDPGSAGPPAPEGRPQCDILRAVLVRRVTSRIPVEAVLDAPIDSTGIRLQNRLASAVSDLGDC